MDKLLEPNWGLAIWTIVSFLLFFLILRRFAWGPILSALDQRERKIRESIEAAARSREESERILAEQKDALKSARDEGRALIAGARADADQEGEKILDRARKESDQLIERARAEIRGEEAQAVERVRREAVDIAMEAATRLLQRSLTESDHRRFVEEFISREGSGKSP